MAMQEVLVGDQIGLSLGRTNTKRAHRGRNAGMKLRDCSGSLNCGWYLPCPKTQNGLTKSESRFLLLARCVLRVIFVCRKRNTYRTNYWSRNTEARRPLNLCITFMHHMYGHDLERKLLVSSRWTRHAGNQKCWHKKDSQVLTAQVRGTKNEPTLGAPNKRTHSYHSISTIEIKHHATEEPRVSLSRLQELLPHAGQVFLLGEADFHGGDQHNNAAYRSKYHHSKT